MKEAILRALVMKGCCALGAALLLPPTALAQGTSNQGDMRSFEEEYEDVMKPWREIETRLPAKPLAENLEPLEVSAATVYQFHIDRASISVGSDGVVRYTLIGTSPSGVKNISYEGIRCDTAEKKLYAFGRPDGTWSRSKRNQWDRIRDEPRNRQHVALRTAICGDSRVPAKDAAAVIYRLRNPPPMYP